jgi:hypothetical protein
MVEWHGSPAPAANLMGWQCLGQEAAPASCNGMTRHHPSPNACLDAKREQQSYRRL